MPLKISRIDWKVKRIVWVLAHSVYDVRQVKFEEAFQVTGNVLRFGIGFG